MKDAKELETEFQKSGTWDFELLSELASLADMEQEWEDATGENFEEVAFRMAEKVGIEILKKEEK